MGEKERSTYNEINNKIVKAFTRRTYKMKKVIEIIMAVISVLVDGKQVAKRLNHDESQLANLA